MKKCSSFSLIFLQHGHERDSLTLVVYMYRLRKIAKSSGLRMEISPKHFDTCVPVENYNRIQCFKHKIKGQ